MSKRLQQDDARRRRIAQEAEREADRLLEESESAVAESEEELARAEGPRRWPMRLAGAGGLCLACLVVLGALAPDAPEAPPGATPVGPTLEARCAEDWSSGLLRMAQVKLRAALRDELPVGMDWTEPEGSWRIEDGRCIARGETNLRTRESVVRVWYEFEWTPGELYGGYTLLGYGAS